MEGHSVYLVICLAFVVNAFPDDHDIPARISTYVPDVDLAPPGRQEEMIGSMEANELLNILGLSKETIPSSTRELSSSSLSSTSSSERNHFAHPFMVNLYNSLADPMSGLTFGRRPYNATKIRAVPEGGEYCPLGPCRHLSYCPDRMIESSTYHMALNVKFVFFVGLKFVCVHMISPHNHFIAFKEISSFIRSF